MKYFAGTAMLALGLAVTTFARAETQDCLEITTIPATITTQGVHCMMGDLTSSSTTTDAITIDTNNVVIDMNGFRLVNKTGGVASSAEGITAVDRKNIVIKNGIIRGFLRGIFMDSTGGSENHLVEDMLILLSVNRGIEIQADFATVRNNRVTNISGAAAVNHGILVDGLGARVINNDVHSILSGQGLTHDVSGIRSLGDSHLIEDNRISNIEARGDAGVAYGIRASGSGHSIIRGNSILQLDGPTTIGVLASADSVCFHNSFARLEGTSSFTLVSCHGVDNAGPAP